MKRNTKSCKGFTLVELVVSMAIAAILIGTVVMGLTQYTRYAEFKRKNEYARSLFNAVQMQLTAYSQLGNLDGLINATENNDVPLESLDYGAGAGVNASDIWGTSDAAYQGSIKYIIATAEDYQAYLNGTLRDGTKTALYDMLDSYVYNKAVLSATVCVELDPSDGLVYSVLYSDKAKSFTYGDDGDDAVSIAKRSTDERKKRMVGYYGVEALSKSSGSETEKPEISNVMLNNSEMLYLSYRLSNIQEALPLLNYEIIVYDAGSGKPLLSIKFNNTKLKTNVYDTANYLLVAGDSRTNHTIEASVSSFDDAGNESNLGLYTFPAWVQSDYTVCFVLDAVDLGATVQNYTGNELENTYSLHRFGVTADSVYCTIQGSGSSYKTTAKKESNSEQPYFGGRTSAETAEHAYAVCNARHLYNMRFEECGNADEGTAYTLTANISWEKLIDDGAVYRDQKKLKTDDGYSWLTDRNMNNGRFTNDQLLVQSDDSSDDKAFVSIYELRGGSVLQSANKVYSISDMYILMERNDSENVECTENDDGNATGLFLVNNGTVKNVKFDDITVTGEDFVGTVCGVNFGTLSNISVISSQNEGSVSGETNVGGVAGGQGSYTQNAAYYGLVNRAKVSGYSYVGGIIGRIESDGGSSVTVSSCKNYGQVNGVTDESGENAAEYIGGIAGYAGEDDGSTLIIEECISYPEYKDEEIYDADSNVLTAGLIGKYVGGIVGYNAFADIRQCSTLAESGTQGCVLGESMVGGIVGYSSGTIDGGGNKNQADVIGREYVGGIVGVNSKLDKNGEPDTHNTYSVVGNWVNEGVVLAVDGYAGGITGLNTGIIYNCSSDTDYDERTKTLAGLEGIGGRCVGGISGYNNGVISADDVQQVTAIVSGENCVGGIVGYNDTDAVITNCQLQGGYISGKVFVGGFAGLNLADGLMEDAVSANPNSVAGAYCVGGVIGGNILTASGNVNAEFNVYNILGSVGGNEFVGGFIGYNCIAQNTNRAEGIVSTIENGLTDDYADNITLLEHIKSSNNSEVMVINGNSGELRSISADVYVGGIIGYNDENTCLHVKNTVNKTPVTAKDAVKTHEQGSGDDSDYAYAGGITGKVTEHAIIDNCENEGSGGVSSNATYTGEIAEINCGLIANCRANNSGTNATDNIGGIAGLNIPTGTTGSFGTGGYVSANFGGEEYADGKNSIYLGIYNCSFTGTLTGRDNAGGITAVNKGTVYAPIIDGTVNACGTNAGGVAGINDTDGSIILEGTLTINVEGGGTAVGGVVGHNKGLLSVISGSDAAFAAVNGGTVSGKENVGGIAGVNSAAGTLDGFVNNNAVTADTGFAGGIVGKIDENTAYSITGCANNGDVQARLSGDAGGITAYASENCLISNCRNSASISAAAGRCGGITAKNDGGVSGCEVSSGDEYGGSDISFIGGTSGGAIAGENTGRIENCFASYIKIENSTGSSSGSFGGIAGMNSGNIILAEKTIENAAVTIYTNSCFAGGIAGTNSGTIEGSASGSYVGTAGASAGLAVGFGGTAADMGSMGGVAGMNSGTVSACVTYAHIEGGRGSSSVPGNGYGGVTGVNSGTVEDCSFDGTVYTDGTVSAISVTGGICGLNTANALIQRCCVGFTDDTDILCGTDSSAFAYLGGVAGWNKGSVIGCDNYTYSAADSVNIIGYAGQIGGIVGFNDENGQVTAEEDDDNIIHVTTGENWFVNARYYSNDCGTGGIIGYSSSGNDIRYADNYADVWNSSGQTSNSAAGGIIGRTENKVKYNFRISYCNNYGDIWSSAISGGMVGRWKYLGGTVEYSNNYGRIGERPSSASNSDSSFSAGIAASYYEVTKNSHIYINSCNNYGDIKSNGSSCGISGNVGQNSGSNIVVANCVNTGSVLNTGTGGTNSGIAAQGSGGRVYIYRCRNYGNVSSSIQSASAGICYGNADYMTGCLNFNNSNNPVSNMNPDSDVNNYYVYAGISSSIGKELTRTYRHRAYSLTDRTKVLNSITGLTRDPTGTGRGTDENGTEVNWIGFTADYSGYEDYTVSNLSSLNSYRYQLIGEIDPKMMNFYYEYYNTAPVISSAKISDDGGAYSVSWSSSIDAYSYDVTYSVDGAVTEGNTVYEENEKYCVVDRDDSWSGKTLTFYVRGVYWKNKGNKYTKQYTDWVASDSVTIKTALPTPQVHLELTGTNSNSFVAVLDNASDYIDSSGNLLDATISYSAGSVSASFRVSAGRSGYINITSAGNAIITMQAQPDTLTQLQKNTYTMSHTKSVQSYIFTVSSLKNTDYCSTAFNGFYGSEADGLYYMLKLNKANDNAETYYYSELLSYDSQLKTYVAKSWGESHVTGLGFEMTATLSKIDNSVLSDDEHQIIVRTYPWRTQSYQTYYGHEVASSATKSELFALKDGGESIYSEADGFKNGYVIQSNGDGTYRVIYSAILDYSSDYAKQIDELRYTVNTGTGTITDSKGKAFSFQPKPAIDGDYSYMADSDSCRFTWDSGKGFAEASYMVKLIGISGDGTEVTLDRINTGSLNYDSENDRWFADFADNNWEYPDIRLEVERLGTTNSDGSTKLFPSSQSAVFNLKIRLSQISAPSVSLHAGNGGIVDKNNLFYDISWTGLNSSSELAALRGYEISVKYTSLYGENENITLLTCESTESVEAAAASSQPAIYAPSDKAEAAVINLNSLSDLGGSTVEVSVRAIAVEDSEIYRNGVDGVVRNVVLPSRIALPELENLNYQYASGGTISVDEFENDGFEFIMSQSYAAKGSYEMTAEIVNASYEHVAYIADSDNPISMSGGLSDGSCILKNISADYAGLYLKVAMRTVSDSSISSIWTYQSDDSMQYAYFRLPTVRVDTPGITETTTQITYTHGSEDEPDWDKLDQTAISFDTQKYASGYSINIVREPENADLTQNEEYKRSGVSSIRLAGNGEAYSVYYEASDSGIYGTGTEVLLGSITDGGDSLVLPYTATDGTGGDSFEMYSQIAVSGGTVTLTLPDCEDENLQATKNVTVQALAGDAENYADSYISSWYRTAVNSVDAASVDTLDSMPDAPEIFADGITVTESERDGFSWEMEFDEDYLVIAELSCGDMKRVYAVPGETGQTGVSSLLLLESGDWGNLGGSEVSLRIRCIVDGEGISGWSDAVTVTLGE